MSVVVWLLRPILIVAAVIASWFVAEDATNFSVVRGTVAVVLIVGIVALASLWEMLAERHAERHK